MDKTLLDKKYHSSKEAIQHLRINSCHLMHLREAGKISFIKKGNAYFYDLQNHKMNG